MTNMGTPVCGTLLVTTQMSVVIMMTMISFQTQCAVPVMVDNGLNSMVNTIRIKIKFDKF